VIGVSKARCSFLRRVERKSEHPIATLRVRFVCLSTNRSPPVVKSRAHRSS
jgi:hypothetical protein